MADMAFLPGNTTLPFEVITGVIITALSVPPVLCILSPNLCFLNLLRPQLTDQQPPPQPPQQPPQQPSQQPPQDLPVLLPRLPGIVGNSVFILGWWRTVWILGKEGFNFMLFPL